MSSIYIDSTKPFSCKESLSALTESRIAAFRNGYRPAPISGIHMNVKSPGKQPVMSGWQQKCAVADESTIRSWSINDPDCTNTGILTGLSGGVGAIDIDVRIQAAADEVRDFAIEVLGRTECWRIGEAPKILGLYRVINKFGKVKTQTFIMPDGNEAAVEFLAEGQQVVAFGFHPKTRQSYKWLGASPASKHIDDLPIADLDAVEVVIEGSAQILRDHGGVLKLSKKRNAGKERPVGSTSFNQTTPTGDNFFSQTNSLALNNLGLWVPSVFGAAAHYQPETKAYRIRSKDLNRTYQEDLSLHPSGIYDFGKEEPLSSIDTVMEHGGAPDAVKAALWLCEKMGADPASLGWSEIKVKPNSQRSADNAKMAYAAKAANTVLSAEDPAPPSDIREIQIVAGELPRVVDKAEAALIAAKAPVYQRGSMLVTVGQTIIKLRDKELIGPRIIPLTSPALVEHMTISATFQKFDGRSESWVPTDCPTKVADTYLARGTWKLRPLAGIIEAPMMRCDGSILDQQGYDAATGLILLSNVDMPPIPERPTKRDAEKALETLKAPIKSFPFATGADWSVALSGILTAICRRAFPSAPLHAFTAPVAGSGKGKIVDTIATIATGRGVSVIPPGKTEEEAEKRLGSALISGDPLISIDNLEQPLGGELLCQSLTQPTLKIRMLGQSLNVEVPSIACMFATGNNMSIQGDMTRRTLVCKIDPGVERPELREFTFDPIAVVGADRGKFIAAALTIMRAYVVAGFPDKLKPLGSFEDWSNHVRSSLVWLGEADPILTMDAARESDPVLSNLRSVMTAWSEVIGHTEQVTSSKLVTYANKTSFSNPSEYIHEALREALLTVAPAGPTISTRSLGKWLKANSERIVDGMRITVAHADAHNGARYLLQKVG